MDDKQLVETALRILSAWTSGREPELAEVQSLRNAFPSLLNAPADELACYVVHTLSSAVFPRADSSPEQQSPWAKIA